ncbi:hypothetical protein [Sphingomonas sp. MMS24-J13]|uniref:hypothetical protein n=1 Tax=Sphingomonas sp. MMS24-J13 TaxID=3238686 RepID=UPI00384E5D59
MHRVRVGALGLAAVFLLVMLATAFLHAAGDPSVVNGNLATTNSQAPSEPLAELGVAPGNSDPVKPKTASSPPKRAQ